MCSSQLTDSGVYAGQLSLQHHSLLGIRMGSSASIHSGRVFTPLGLGLTPEVITGLSWNPSRVHPTLDATPQTVHHRCHSTPVICQTVSHTNRLWKLKHKWIFHNILMPKSKAIYHRSTETNYALPTNVSERVETDCILAIYITRQYSKSCIGERSYSKSHRPREKVKHEAIQVHQSEPHEVCLGRRNL